MPSINSVLETVTMLDNMGEIIAQSLIAVVIIIVIITFIIFKK